MTFVVAMPTAMWLDLANRKDEAGGWDRVSGLSAEEFGLGIAASIMTPLLAAILLWPPFWLQVVSLLAMNMIMLVPWTISVRFKITYAIYLIFPLWVSYALEAQRKNNFMKTLEMKQLQRRNIAEILDLKAKEDYERRMLLSAAAHDLRTPVCAVASSSNLLAIILAEQIHEPAQQNKADKVLELIRTAVQIGLGTVDNLLTSSQLLSGKSIHPVLGGCNVRQIVNSSVLLTCQAYLSQDIKCSSNVTQDVPETIISDGAWLQQMILNLLSNAFKYTREGHVLLTAEVAPPSLQDKFKCSRQANPLQHPAILIMVEDTGTGVDPQKKPKLFQEVTQASFNGTGIGLYTTGEKTVSMGGACGHFSHAHGGSVFWFTVPVSGSMDDLLPPPPPPQQPSCLQGHMEISQIKESTDEDIDPMDDEDIDLESGESGHPVPNGTAASAACIQIVDSTAIGVKDSVFA